jgi:multidrug efflux pump subunit AcrB
MKATKTSFSDIINAIAQENVTVSAGSLNFCWSKKKCQNNRRGFKSK